MSKYQYAALVLFLSLSISALLVSCGASSPPPEFQWDSSPKALVASLGTAGGNVPSMIRFTESLYGDDFVVLAGDGRLFWGKPHQAQQRALAPLEMQDLLGQVRPDLLVGLEAQYIAGQATDLPTTSLAVQVKGYASKVGVYGLGFTDGQPQGAVPASVLGAVKALRAATAQPGQAVKPTRLMIGADKIDAERSSVDLSQAAAWPLSDVDLAQARMYVQPEQARVLSGRQVEQVLPLLESTPDSSWTGKLFRQGTDYFWVGYAVVLF